MRVLLLGGTRFIGPVVVKQLNARGHELAVFHRGLTETDLPPEVRHLHGERQRLTDFRDELARFGPEVVLDLCALTEPDALIAVQVFRSIACRAVVVSSGDVYYNYGLFGHTGTETGPPYPYP